MPNAYEQNGITLAVSCAWHTFPDRFEWVREKGLAMEYSPDPENLLLLPSHLSMFNGSGTPIRHHAYFPQYEIAHADREFSEQSMQIYFNTLHAMDGWGEPVLTIHIGLNPEYEILPDRAIANMERLVEYARGLGITICLENLRKGLTSHPENVLDWAERTGASITLDIGHANSCERVQKGDLTVMDYIDMFGERILEVHMYESENDLDGHRPPSDMTILGPIIDRLLETRCRWWTIELERYDDIDFTRGLVEDYLFGSKGFIHGFGLRA